MFVRRFVRRASAPASLGTASTCCERTIKRQSSISLIEVVLEQHYGYSAVPLRLHLKITDDLS